MSPLFADLAAPNPLVPRSLDAPTLALYGGVAAGVLVLLVIAVLVLRGRRRKRVDPEEGLEEDLAAYPPPPGKPGPRRLTVHGRPVRLRLVVVAPVGRQAIAEGGAVEALLDEVLRGLGGAARQDRPRVRVWPPQLSQQGFAPTFFRRTHCPDRPGKPSHWLLAAGPARAGGRPVLLGLALYGDDPAPMEQATLSEAEWDEALQFRNV